MTRQFGDRRNARGSSGAVQSDGLDAAIKALSPYSFMVADRYSVDGVTGKVSAFSERVAAGTGILALESSHSFAQSTDANQVAIPAASASFGNARVATFAGGQRYVSTAPASRWRFLHDGTGADVVIAVRQTGGGTYRILGTTAIGTGLWWDLSANSNVNVYSAGVYQLFMNGAITSDDKYLSYDYATANSPDARQFKRTAANGTDNDRVAPSAGDPTASLTFGASIDGSSALVGELACLIVFDRVTSAGERTAIASYMSAKYGVP